MGSLLTSAPSRYLSAGQLTLDLEAHALTGPAGTCKVEPGPFIVLREMLRRPGATVLLDKLIETSWPDADLEPKGDAARAVRMRVFRARAAMTRVGVPGDRLELVFQEGYRLALEPAVVRLFTPAQAAALDRLLAQHPLEMAS